MSKTEVRHFHLFCGLGGGAQGFNEGEARVGRAEADFRCLGGIDSMPEAIKDFDKKAGVKGTVLDLFDRDQYIAWHGHEPPSDWSEATPADIRNAAGNERPHIVFTSPPCKGFSGLLPERKSKGDKYQALNALTVRGIMLSLEAWKDDPPEFFLLENVPRIQHRGRYLVDRICSILQHYGYVTAETTHNCGELGGLAQNRNRFLLVARHAEKVPPFLYEPVKQPCKAVGDVLGSMLMPGDPEAGAMHRLPELMWRTWVRLAFVEAGKDWRSLQRLACEDGFIKDYGVVPHDEYGFGGILGVTPWDQTAATVAGRSGCTNGAYSVADPRRHEDRGQYGQYGVVRWNEVGQTVTGKAAVGSGKFAIADPRPGQNAKTAKFNNCYRVVRWDDTCPTVTGGGGPSAGGLALSDPRGYTAGEASNGGLPAPDDRGVVQIISEDGTWHRPFTTLEMAVMQGLAEPDEYLELFGSSTQGWRERIGNAVPPPAARAIAGVMGTTLLLNWTESSLALPFTPVWVQPIATAISVDSRQGPAGLEI